MLAIRMQRVGRKGHPQYRVIVQEAFRQPTSGRIVAQLGSYNPHTKAVTLDKEKAETYLKNGAQPSPRVVRILESEKVALPKWVKKAENDKQKAIRNPEKLRRNQPEAPAEPTKEAPAPEATEEVAAEPTEVAAAEAPAEEKPATEEAESKPAEDETAPVEEAPTEAVAETSESAPESEQSETA